MGSSKKTDNSHLREKLDLRRYFLRKYHSEGSIRVLDCCQGSGLIWGALRKEFKVERYWGVDVKPKKGRLKLQSERILAQPGWTENVIDIDTYGAPWKHYSALVRNCSHAVTVFLTIGQVQMGVTKIVLERMGLIGLDVPPGLWTGTFHQFGTRYALAECLDHGFQVIEAMEARVGQSHARYLGVRLIGMRLEPGAAPAAKT